MYVFDYSTILKKGNTFWFEVTFFKDAYARVIVGVNDALQLFKMEIIYSKGNKCI